MIITGLLNVIHFLLDKLLIFSIPNLPDQALSYVNTAFEYIANATGIVANYTPLSYLLILFGIVIAIDVALMLYNFVMWILRKIPVLGIS